MQEKINIKGQSCPSRKCKKARVHIHSQKQKRLRCSACNKTWVTRAKTPHYGLKKSPQDFNHAQELYLAGYSIREMAKETAVSPSTIFSWIKRFQNIPNPQHNER